MVKAGSLKKRYVLFRLQGPDVDEKTLKRGLYNEALRFFGEYGASEAALKLISYDEKKKMGIIRCERDYLDRLLGLLAILSSLDRLEARLVPLKSSGTVRSLESVLDSAH